MLWTYSFENPSTSAGFENANFLSNRGHATPRSSRNTIRDIAYEIYKKENHRTIIFILLNQYHWSYKFVFYVRFIILKIILYPNAQQQKKG